MYFFILPVVSRYIDLFLIDIVYYIADTTAHEQDYEEIGAENGGYASNEIELTVQST